MTKCVVCDGTGVMDDTPPAKDPNLDWWEKHQEELNRDYPGKHIAIHGEDGVVASHESIVEVDKMLVKKGLKETSLMMYINPPAGVEEPMLKSLQYPDEKGGISARISHSIVPVIAEEFMKLCKEGGGVNYLELTMSPKNDPEFGDVVVTIQRRNGHTPGTKASAYKEVLRDIATNFDCDQDAHKYKTTCRACAATEALTKYEGKV